MEIVPIFASDNLSEKGGLLAIRYMKDMPDEYEKLFENWTNSEWIKNYLERNNEWLASDFFKSYTKDEIIASIENEVILLEDFFIQLSEKGFNTKDKTLQYIFRPLFNGEYKLYPLQPQKSRVADRLLKMNVLRIYAIRIHNNLFIITGGAIKLTQNMEGHPDTKKELDKIKGVVSFLKGKDISTADDLIYYYDNPE